MNKFEFISLKEYPEGQYPTAIATVRVTHFDKSGYPSREVLRYARKNSKDGGIFWAMATHSVVVNGEKKYLPGFKPDSDIDEEMLVDFIKESVKNLLAPKAAPQGQIHYPHGLVQPATSMSEVVQEEIPF